MLRRMILLMVWLGAAGAAQAQTDELQLSVRRNVGYSGGGQIQGSFRMEASGPATLMAVTFRVDQAVVGAVTQPPFRINFNTDDYGLGQHTLTAEGATSDGRTLSSAPRQFEFVSEAESWRAVGKILAPILVVVGIALVIGLGVPLAQALRGKPAATPPGAQRRYGLMGGAICPKCGRPFARHWWGLNAGLSKYDRCDNCGKWSLVRAEPLERLRAAEAAELAQEMGASPAELSPEEKLRRQLDDSRYSDP